MGERREYGLSDLAEVVDCEHKTAPLIDESEYISIRTTDILGGRIDFENANRVSLETYEDWTKRAIPREGDIILAREAPVGEVGLVTKGRKVCLGQRTVLLRANSEIADARYLLYRLADPNQKYELVSRSTGSVVEHLNVKDIREFRIAILESISEQRAIASVLSSLDDKIDLLHRQNKTLEALAETLFRQWFVEEGKEDWDEISLYDCIQIVGGGTPRTEMPSYWGGDVKWISGRDITPNHRQFIIETEKSITDTGVENSSAKVIPEFSTVISARGTVGKYCLLGREMAFSQTNYGILPKFPHCYFFTYLLMAHSVGELQAAAYGSVFDTITTNTFKEHKVNVPPESEVMGFEEKVSAYFKKMLSNSQQIRALARMRDTLLPKLMSGEVRVNQL